MRDQIDSFDRRFAEVNARQRELVSKIDEDLLYVRRSQRSSMLPDSVGEYELRSAAAIEQMIGGVTTRLWDDPFEWTLPEQLPTRNDVLNCLQEVEESRQRGFAFFRDDDDLNKTLPAPIEFRTLEAILNDTLERAQNLYDQALVLDESLE